jgi:TonB family protein
MTWDQPHPTSYRLPFTVSLLIHGMLGFTLWFSLARINQVQQVRSSLSFPILEVLQNRETRAATTRKKIKIKKSPVHLNSNQPIQSLKPSDSEGEWNPFLEYSQQVREKIASSLDYPLLSRTRSIGGTAHVRVIIQSDGSLESAKLTQSSGLEALDRSVLRAVLDSAPFPTFNETQAKMGKLILNLPIVFKQP